MARSEKNPDPRSRRAVIELLKRSGPRDARSLAEELGLSAMAVRQHLYELHGEKLVTYEEQPRPVGRPAKLWRLTRAADRFFPDAHAELAVGLIGCVADSFGREGLDALIRERARRQIADYRRRIPARASLRRRVEALAAIRTAEGYMAEALPQPDGSLLLVENHCPICTAATACTGLCAAELDVFRAVLGGDAEVERTEHIIAGARRCAYRVRKRRRGRIPLGLEG